MASSEVSFLFKTCPAFLDGAGIRARTGSHGGIPRGWLSRERQRNWKGVVDDHVTIHTEEASYPSIHSFLDEPCVFVVFDVAPFRPAVQIAVPCFISPPRTGTPRYAYLRAPAFRSCHDTCVGAFQRPHIWRRLR